MDGKTESTRLSEAAAWQALQQAAAETGVSIVGAELLRLGENALYGLHEAELVVRIARSVDRMATVHKELQVARWLAELGYPAARVAEQVEQPLIVDGRPVTFWQLIAAPVRQPTLDDLARLIRGLHDLDDPPFELPAVDPLHAVPGRLAEAVGVPADDLAFLAERCRELGERYGALDFPGRPGLIHGDAHRGNILVDEGGPVLLDLEAAAWGPREWDLVPTAMAVRRLRLPAAEYASFVAGYGRDVTAWPGYEVLRDIRELTMTTWLMQNIGESPQIAAEFTGRVASLRKGDLDHVWRAF